MNLNMNTILGNRSRTQIIIIGLVLVFFLSYINSFIDYRVNFAIFYVLPIVIVTWYAGLRTGILFSFLSTGIWFVISVYLQRSEDSLAILGWNSAVRLGIFIIISTVLHHFQSERTNARLDVLTHIPNRRYFLESLQAEINRCTRFRRPLTLALMDVDNFKYVNDRYGHPVGDELLETVSRIITGSVRSTDVVSRLGGDEFALIFAETGLSRALKKLDAIHQKLRDAMLENHWPVSFSFGLATFRSFPQTVHEVFRITDECLYAAKRAGKDRVESRMIK